MNCRIDIRSFLTMVIFAAMVLGMVDEVNRSAGVVADRWPNGSITVLEDQLDLEVER